VVFDNPIEQRHHHQHQAIKKKLGLNPVANAFLSLCISSRKPTDSG
jgi:hypothetical protein